MKIVYYTSGVTGTGRIVRGISIYNALKRKRIDAEYTILHSSDFGKLCDAFHINHIKIPLEDDVQLSPKNYEKSALFKTITKLSPDVIIYDLLWFPMYHFIDTLPCKKILLCRLVFDNFFIINTTYGKLTIKPEQFDMLLSCEPFVCSIPMNQINPIILRNKNEIYPRDIALDKLNLDGSEPICVYAFNHHPEDFGKHLKKYSYFKDIGYKMVYTTNYKGGIFPLVDYFNAFDYIISGAGYNIFWEVIYFDKEAVFENFAMKFSSTEYRINSCQEYYFEENGADQLVDMILKL